MRQSSARGAVRPRCLPKLPGVQNGAVNARGVVRLHCLRTCFPGALCGLRKWRAWAAASTPNHRNNNNDDDLSATVDSISEAGGQGSPTATADAREWSIPHDASHSESTFHHTPGSSQESSPATGTNNRCNISTPSNTGTPNTLSLPLSPNLSVLSQTSQGEERDAGAGEPVNRARQPRRAAQQQRNLMESLLREDLIETYLPL